jgi:hypothetical protein
VHQRQRAAEHICSHAELEDWFAEHDAAIDAICPGVLHSRARRN